MAQAWGYLVNKKNTESIIPINKTAKLILNLWFKHNSENEIAEKISNIYDLEEKKSLYYIKNFFDEISEKLKIEDWRLLKGDYRYHPIRAMLYLTSRCNLSCKHCYANSKINTKTKELYTKEWKTILKELKDLDVPNIIFLGGEPFMKENFYELLKFANRLEFGKIIISTNGNKRLLKNNYKILDFIEKNPTNFRVSVSLEGGKPKTHNKIRGKGNFEKTLKGIKELINRGLNVRLGIVLTKGNCNEIEEMINLAKQLQVEKITFNPLMPSGRGSKLKKIMLNPSELVKFDEKIHKLNEISKNEIDIKSRLVPNTSDTFKSSKDILSTSNLCGCGGGTRHIYITSEGYLVPCPMLLGDKKYYSKKKAINNIKNIWFDDPSIHNFRKLTSELNLRGKCKKCNSKEICRGGCHTLSYFLTGKFNNPDPRCDL